MLEFLDENLFQNMPQLTFVNLESNNLVTVSEFKNKEIFVILSGKYQRNSKISILRFETFYQYLSIKISYDHPPVTVRED